MTVCARLNRCFEDGEGVVETWCFENGEGVVETWGGGDLVATGTHGVSV